MRVAITSTGRARTPIPETPKSQVRVFSMNLALPGTVSLLPTPSGRRHRARRLSKGGVAWLPFERTALPTPAPDFLCSLYGVRDKQCSVIIQALFRQPHFQSQVCLFVVPLTYLYYSRTLH